MQVNPRWSISRRIERPRGPRRLPFASACSSADGATRRSAWIGSVAHDGSILSRRRLAPPSSNACAPSTKAPTERSSGMPQSAPYATDVPSTCNHRARERSAARSSASKIAISRAADAMRSIAVLPPRTLRAWLGGHAPPRADAASKRRGIQRVAKDPRTSSSKGSRPTLWSMAASSPNPSAPLHRTRMKPSRRCAWTWRAVLTGDDS